MAHTGLWKYLISNCTSSQILINMSHLYFAFHKFVKMSLKQNIFGYSVFLLFFIDFRIVISISLKTVIGILIGILLNV
jgi:hypothetical protein